jgi:hypothetical protein
VNHWKGTNNHPEHGYQSQYGPGWRIRTKLFMITGTVKLYGRNKAGIKDNKLACNRVYLDMDSFDNQFDTCTEKSSNRKVI